MKRRRRFLPDHKGRGILAKNIMKTGERQTTRAVDVWRAAPDLPVFGVHVSIDGASWTCGAVRGWDVDGLADGLEALLA